MSISFDDLKRALREIELEKQSQQPQQPPEPKESHSEHILNCPTCYADTVKGMEKMKETSEVFCSDCDLALGSKEFAEKIDNCPRCGSKKGYVKKR